MMSSLFSYLKPIAAERTMIVSWPCLTWRSEDPQDEWEVEEGLDKSELRIPSITLSNGLVGHLNTTHMNLLFTSQMHQKPSLPLNGSLSANENGIMERC
jgi:hypothetical protein